MTLREQVREQLRGKDGGKDVYRRARLRVHRHDAFDDVVDAAVGLALAAVAEQVDEPLRNRLHEIELDDVHGYERALDDVLAVLARLGGEA